MTTNKTDNATAPISAGFSDDKPFNEADYPLAITTTDADADAMSEYLDGTYGDSPAMNELPWTPEGDKESD